MARLRVNLPTPINPPLPAIDVSYTLDGQPYVLSFQWAARSSSWFLRVYDGTGQTLLMGETRISVNWPLYLSRPGSMRKPPGLLVVYDTAGKGEDPQLATLGGRHLLYYLTSSDLPEGF